MAINLNDFRWQRHCRGLFELPWASMNYRFATDTRLMLDRKLEDDIIEKMIYQKRDLKWRKHRPGAINNCSIMEAHHYRDMVQLRD